MLQQRRKLLASAALSLAALPLAADMAKWKRIITERKITPE